MGTRNSISQWWGCCSLTSVAIKEAGIAILWKTSLRQGFSRFSRLPVSNLFQCQTLYSFEILLKQFVQNILNSGTFRRCQVAQHLVMADTNGDVDPFSSVLCDH